MSELLTTGQMIGRLKIGEKAVGDVSELGKVIQVIKRESGCIKLYEDGFGERTLMLDGGVVDSVKWRIEPNYVSFYEAMKALKDAKLVYFHDGDWKARIIYGQWLEDSEISGYTFAQIINGKWTIEE